MEPDASARESSGAPSLTLFEVALLDKERTKDTEGCVFVAEIVRFRTSRHRPPKSNDFGYIRCDIRRNAQLQYSRFGFQRIHTDSQSILEANDVICPTCPDS